jgi:hypothetical protein
MVQRVCEVSAELLGITGAGMCVIGGLDQQIIVHGTDTLTQQLEDLQLSLAEGPCIEAVRSNSAVLVPSLEQGSPTWSRFAEQAVTWGVRALFAFPLVAGERSVGALDLYRDTAGPLDPRQLEDVALLTQIATQSMLAQQDSVHLDGAISALHWLTAPDRGARRRRAVDLGITVAEARAPAVGEDRDDRSAPRTDQP